MKKQENSNFYFGFPFHSFHGPDRLSVRSIPPKVHDPDLAGRADRYIPDLYDLYDLYDLARVARWEPYNLQDLGHVSWVGSVLLLLLSFTASDNGRLGSR